MTTSKGSNREKHLQYFWEEKRLESFKKWAFKDSDECNKEKLAEAGFFSVATRNEPDAVQCFICNKQLDGWESTDDPWQEHTKHAKNCLFVQLGKPEEMLTVYELYDLFKAMMINVVTMCYNEKKNELKAEYEETVKLFEKVMS